MEEQIEEIDGQGNTIAIHPRSKLKKTMFPHKAALVIPKGNDNKLILCKRAKDMYPFPGTWCCAIGGKVAHGETIEEAAKRESYEEANTSPELEQIIDVKYNEDDYKAIFSVFTTKESFDTSHFTPDPREIQYFQEFSIEEIETMITQNPELFAPTFTAIVIPFIQEIKSKNLIK
jgi:8-oxo-dGTP pyrophosphatase MutT (NUDIX family)